MPWTAKTTKELSKTLSYYLRHAPWEAELIPDSAGWVSTRDLLSALNDSYAGLVTLDTIKQVMSHAVDTGDRERFELSEDDASIRARYGHSFKIQPPEDPAVTVPKVLYHGTTIEASDLIHASMAVKPMGRSFVHWTTEPDMAKSIGRRHRGKRHIMLFLDAVAAHEEGISFYDCGNGIWLTEEMPVRFTTKGPTF